jgi:outer membrane lipoprotein-sorting protein
VTDNEAPVTSSSSRSFASLLTRRRAAWAAPAVGLAVVAAAVGIPMVASASPSLPHKTAAQLLVDVAKSGETPLSGTVVETARLGLPALPDIGGTAISPAALVAGSHTARVWYDGGDKARIALVGNLAETDLVRNGRDAWLWTSGRNTAQHWRLPAHATASSPASPASPSSPSPSPSAAESVTPQQAARQALAAVSPTTKVTVDGTASVAGRSAYELVLAPRDSRSLVGDVRIAVDAKTSVPLRVQIHARGATGRPAFETTFTSVSFSKPSASVFRFSPPPGAKVTTSNVAHSDVKDTARTADHGSSPKVIGTGWTAVVELSGVSLPAGGGGEERHHGSTAADQLSALTRAMTPVSGAFGSGHLLRTKLVTVLLLDDGRAFVGAVSPAFLEQAAAK